MVEDSAKKDQEDSSWLKWVKKKSIAMNKRFRRTNSDFLNNLKKRNKNKP